MEIRLWEIVDVASHANTFTFISIILCISIQLTFRRRADLVIVPGK